MNLPRRALGLSAALGLVLAAGGHGGGPPPPPIRTDPAPLTSGSPATIAVDRSVTFQTMSGWEAGIAELRAFVENLRLIRPQFLDAVADLGINRLRVELRSGLEHTDNTWGEWQARKLGKNDPWWLERMFETVNDNDDPFSINPNGFHFEDLDFDIDEVVNPLRERLARNGESLFVNFTYVAFTQATRWRSSYAHKDPEEYAEFVLAAYQHVQGKYGWVPDSWEIILEPDNSYVLEGSRSFLKYWSYWHGTDIGRAVVAAGNRLKAAGFTPRFVLPSTLNMTKALAYFDDAIAVPGAREYISALSYHRYSDPTDAALAQIAARVERYGIESAMLEHIGGGYEELHKDLTLGRNSAWAQYRLATVGSADSGGVYFGIDAADHLHPRLVMGHRTGLLRQYFKFIRRGDKRVGATTSDSTFNPVAFVHPTGGAVIVVKARRGGAFVVHGLPAGTYGVKYTTETEYDVDRPDTMVPEGGTLSTAIPARGALTIYVRDQDITRRATLN